MKIAWTSVSVKSSILIGTSMLMKSSPMIFSGEGPGLGSHSASSEITELMSRVKPMILMSMFRMVTNFLI